MSQVEGDSNPIPSPGKGRAGERETGTAVPGWLRLLVPSLADMLFVALLLGLSCGALGRLLLRDADIGWHIRNGEQMLATHTIARADSFSSTMSGHTWYAWEWLYDVWVAKLRHAFGLNGVVFYTAAIIAATFVLALHVGLRRGATLPVMLVLLLLALGAAAVHFLARPHVFSWLFTVIWFALLDSASDEHQEDRSLLWLPPLMILWVNLHGGFVLGLLLLAIYLVGGGIEYLSRREGRAALAKRMRWLSAVSMLTFAASLVNPYGYQLHAHIYRYLSDRFLMNQISEFLSPDFHGGAQQCFALLLIAAIVAIATARQAIKPSQLLVVISAAYLGCYATRNLPTSGLLIALVVAPILSDSLAYATRSSTMALWLKELLTRIDSFGSRMRRLELGFRGHFWMVAVFVLGLWACFDQGRVGPTRLFHAYFDAKRFPVEATNYISAHRIREPIFSLDYWGGYLIYRIYPESKVVLDDRHDLYGDRFFKDYLKVVSVQPGWEKVLNDLGVDWVLVPGSSSLANMLRLTREWTVAHEDGTAILFQRTATTSNPSEGLAHQ
ncbi:MAG TPA: hypothetical protein VEK33_23740 [Terriglobales bacterium]|nr:hypothetical protein [Terriglobales bacterium]